MDLPADTSIAYNGKNYRCSPLTIGDLLEHEKRIKEQIIAEAKVNMIGLPLEMSKHVWNEAKAEAKKIQIGSSEWNTESLKMQGLMYALELSIRRHQADIKPETILKMFEADLSKASDKAMEMLGYKTADPFPTPQTAGQQATP